MIFFLVLFTFNIKCKTKAHRWFVFRVNNFSLNIDQVHQMLYQSTWIAIATSRKSFVAFEAQKFGQHFAKTYASENLLRLHRLTRLSSIFVCENQFQSVSLTLLSISIELKRFFIHTVNTFINQVIFILFLSICFFCFLFFCTIDHNKFCSMLNFVSFSTSIEDFV